VVAADEAVIAPGNYSDADLGNAQVAQVAGNVHGAAGKPRPVITYNGSYRAFSLDQSSETLSHVEVVSTGPTNVIFVSLGTVERVVVRSSAAGSFACSQINGIFRDSACLTTGANATALGNIAAGLSQPVVRNVTAISTGADSNGIHFSNTVGGTSASVRATIARGAGTDVKASRTAAAGVSVTITMTNSNYANPSSQDASATVVNNGGNTVHPPQLAADGYHQLPTSNFTIDLGGAFDPSSGSADIDGQYRNIGPSASSLDIGADELGNSTSTALACSPASSVLGSGSSACTVTLTDTADSSTSSPLGPVAFSSSGAGSFSGGGSCSLVALGAGFFASECAISYTPASAGTHTLTAAYPGDQGHEPSQGATALTVTNPAVTATTPPTGQRAAALRKCKKKKTKKAKKKCRKKARKLPL
jgi:hypothetical protein